MLFLLFQVHCSALYDFEASGDEEIKLKKHDQIQILENSDENWWKGVNQRTGKTGIFPATYVKMAQ